MTINFGTGLHPNLVGLCEVVGNILYDWQGYEIDVFTPQIRYLAKAQAKNNKDSIVVCAFKQGDGTGVSRNFDIPIDIGQMTDNESVLFPRDKNGVPEQIIPIGTFYQTQQHIGLISLEELTCVDNMIVRYKTLGFAPFQFEQMILEGANPGINPIYTVTPNGDGDPHSIIFDKRITYKDLIQVAAFRQLG